MSDFREDLCINKYELAELWETHTDRFMNWGEKYSEAILERDELKIKADVEKAKAKDALELVRSDLDVEYRTNYTKYGLKRQPSDKTVDSLVASSQDFVKEKQKYYAVLEKYGILLSKAEYNVNVLKAAKEAFEHRKSALDNLTRLMVGGFYSCKLPRDIKEDVMEERNKKRLERDQESTRSMRRRRSE